MYSGRLGPPGRCVPSIYAVGGRVRINETKRSLGIEKRMHYRVQIIDRGDIVFDMKTGLPLDFPRVP